MCQYRYVCMYIIDDSFQKVVSFARKSFIGLEVSNCLPASQNLCMYAPTTAASKHLKCCVASSALLTTTESNSFVLVVVYIFVFCFCSCTCLTAFPSHVQFDLNKYVCHSPTQHMSKAFACNFRTHSISCCICSALLLLDSFFRIA